MAKTKLKTHKDVFRALKRVLKKVGRDYVDPNSLSEAKAGLVYVPCVFSCRVGGRVAHDLIGSIFVELKTPVPGTRSPDNCRSIWQMQDMNSKHTKQYTKEALGILFCMQGYQDGAWSWGEVETKVIKRWEEIEKIKDEKVKEKAITNLLNKGL